MTSIDRIDGRASRLRAAAGLAMNRLRTAVLLLLVVAWGGVAASETRPALWKVTNASAEAWLFGSVHLGMADLYPLPPTIEAALERAKVLAVEIDLERLDPAEQSATLARIGLYPPGESLLTHADAALVADLDAACARLGMPCTPLHGYRPWLISLTLALRSLDLAGFEVADGVDQHLIDRARAHARVVGLETLDDQLGFFGGLANAQQLVYLRETLDELDEAVGLVETIYAAWRRGDVDSVDRLVNGELRNSEVPGLYEALMIKRNTRMADGVDALLREGQPLFVVVGAGHLAGQGSVQDVLRARGWTIERVNY